MKGKIPRRIHRIQDPVVPIVAAHIQANPGTISLGQGVVHFPPPEQVKEAVGAFFDQPAAHLYTPDWGLIPLVEALGRKLSVENGIDMAGKRVVVTAGANMAFLNAVLALTDPGDEVVLLSPYYFNHEMAVQLASCNPVIVPTNLSLTPDLEAIERAITPRTRAVVTVSPNNPTGMAYSRAELSAVNALCRDRGIYHISDEAYEYFLYEGAEHYSPAADARAGEHTIALYSFSKSYGFASWRVGYMVVPESLFEPIMKIQDTNVICAPAVSQYAALACLDVGAAYCRSYLSELAEVRALALDALGTLGDTVNIPGASGAFYVYLEVMRPLDPFDLVKRLIAEHKVAAIPGSAFGSGDRCFLRVSYGALRPAQVQEGIGRLVEGLERFR